MEGWLKEPLEEKLIALDLTLSWMKGVGKQTGKETATEDCAGPLRV